MRRLLTRKKTVPVAQRLQVLTQSISETAPHLQPASRQRNKSPVLRVFISSTFRDMQSERDELIRYVFPRLNEDFRAQGVRIEAVDLRWGVLDGDPVVDVCRDLIDDAELFLGLLGERYGWVPDGHQSSITADEIIYGVLDKPGMRDAACFLFRDGVSSRSVLDAEDRGFAEPIGSKTYQDLLDIKDRIRRTFPETCSYKAVWNEEASRFEGLSDFSTAAYDALKQIVSKRLASFELSDDDGQTPEDMLHAFYGWEHARNFVSDGLGSAIREVDAFIWSQFDLKEPITSDPLEQEKIEELAARRISESLEKYRSPGRDNSDSARPLAKLTPEQKRKKFENIAAIFGPPGSGRTAFIAHLAQRYENRNDLQIISHFVGASERSTSYEMLFRRLLSKIGISVPQDILPHSADYRLLGEVKNGLAGETGDKPILFLFDAVDSLEKRADTNAIGPNIFVEWGGLFENAAAIISYDSGSSLQINHADGPKVALRELPHPQRQVVCQEFLDRHGKRLNELQLDRLIKKADAGLPAYLHAALNELALFGSYEGLDRHIAELPATIEHLFDFILSELCKNPIFVDPLGRIVAHQFVPRVLGLLAAAHGGLSTSELFALVAGPEVGLDPERNVPALVQTLQPYLQTRGERHLVKSQFMREAIARASKQDALFGGKAVHAQLADYFLQALSKGPSTHRLRREVLHNLIASGRLEEAVNVLLPLTQEAAARQALDPHQVFLRMSAQEQEVKMVADVLSNWAIGNWHPEAADHLQNGGAENDYLEVYQYPCCKTYAVCEYIHPPRFILSGCRVKDNSVAYEAAKMDAISTIFLSDASIDQVLQGLL